MKAVPSGAAGAAEDEHSSRFSGWEGAKAVGMVDPWVVRLMRCKKTCPWRSQPYTRAQARPRKPRTVEVISHGGQSPKPGPRPSSLRREYACADDIRSGDPYAGPVKLKSSSRNGLPARGEIRLTRIELRGAGLQQVHRTRTPSHPSAGSRSHRRQTRRQRLTTQQEAHGPHLEPGDCAKRDGAEAAESGFRRATKLRGRCCSVPRSTMGRRFKPCSARRREPALHARRGALSGVHWAGAPKLGRTALHGGGAAADRRTPNAGSTDRDRRQNRGPVVLNRRLGRPNGHR